MNSISVNIGTKALVQKRTNGFLNCGDAHSNPLLHFPRKGFDFHDLFDDSLRSNHVILGGGGLWHSGGMLNSMLGWLGKSSGKKIAWGVGHNSHQFTKVQFMYREEFDLFGVRDWGVKQKNVEWVPCSSCMIERFDDIPEATHEVVALMHQNRHTKVDEAIPMLQNGQSLTQILNHIFSGDTVLTNSYHGAYWATLAGRKTILIEPFSTRFYQFRFQPAIASSSNWKSVAKHAPQFSESLEVCRAVNREFDAKVSDLFS